jgi:hypothetical protein
LRRRSPPRRPRDVARHGQIGPAIDEVPKQVDRAGSKSCSSTARRARRHPCVADHGRP